MFFTRTRRERQISSQDLLDSELMQRLKRAVENKLRAELSGEESDAELKELVEGIVDEELDLV